MYFLFALNFDWLIITYTFLQGLNQNDFELFQVFLLGLDENHSNYFISFSLLNKLLFVLSKLDLIKTSQEVVMGSWMSILYIEK